MQNNYILVEKRCKLRFLLNQIFRETLHINNNVIYNNNFIFYHIMNNQFLVELTKPSTLGYLSYNLVG